MMVDHNIFLLYIKFVMMDRDLFMLQLCLVMWIVVCLCYSCLSMAESDMFMKTIILRDGGSCHFHFTVALWLVIISCSCYYNVL